MAKQTNQDVTFTLKFNTDKRVTLNINDKIEKVISITSSIFDIKESIKLCKELGEDRRLLPSQTCREIDANSAVVVCITEW